MIQLIKKKNKKIGFTLIEMMVSVAIFTIIMTVGIGALVSVLKKYEVAQQQKTAADSLNFVLENITREVRLGSQYYSFGSEEREVKNKARDGATLYTGDSKNLIGFIASDKRGYIIYFIDSGVLKRLRYTLNSAGDAYDDAMTESMTDPTQVIIKKMRVAVMNAGSTEDQKQPLVWMQIVAASPQNTDREYMIQTLVSQRLLDA